MLFLLFIMTWLKVLPKLVFQLMIICIIILIITASLIGWVNLSVLLVILSILVVEDVLKSFLILSKMLFRFLSNHKASLRASFLNSYLQLRQIRALNPIRGVSFLNKVTNSVKCTLFMKIKNNTHYYSISNKIYNVVPDSDSWEFESSRRLSYSQRLYWEYRYVKSVGGQAFFYTFTYNNASLPHYDFIDLDDKDKPIKRHMPCFSYEHIRLLTNGLISKQLRRKYGSQLRYFVACERGEGKGVRGRGLNPHYHVIFFISPLPEHIRKKKDPPYKRISPISFCHLCKCVWQYNLVPGTYDRLVADYKSARFGHCQAGDDLGLVSDFDALSYVAKYVCKDASLSSDDKAIKASFIRKFKELGYTYHSLYFYYQYLRLNGSIFSREEFLDISGLKEFQLYRSIYKFTHHKNVNVKYGILKYLDTFHYGEYDKFWADFKQFFNSIYLPLAVSQSYRDYYNSFGAKVRTSKSLGIYGLNFVRDIDSEPHFVIDSSDDVKPQPICMYYYRKLFMNVETCPVTGNPLYVLNQRGLDLKCKRLSSDIHKLYNSLESCISFFNSNISNDNVWSFASIYGLSKLLFNEVVCDSNLHSVLYRFAVYRKVYQYRHYSTFNDSPALDKGFYFENFVSDYRKFLQSNFYTADYEDIKLINILPFEFKRDSHVISFLCHPLFSPYSSKFEVLDLFFDCYIAFKGNQKKRDFDESREVRMHINTLKYSSVNSL